MILLFEVDEPAVVVLLFIGHDSGRMVFLAFARRLIQLFVVQYWMRWLFMVLVERI